MTTTRTDAAPTGHEAAALLERTRAAVDPELRSTLETLPGAMRRIGMYHFGWEHSDGSPAAGQTGKAIRPALVLAAVQALNGEVRQAVRAATAVELVHNFTLLHDDVIDRDVTRRHRATAWTVFGIPDAIITGDAMQALALRLLTDDPHPAAKPAAGRLATCVIELCAGQQADCAFESRADVSLDECLVMAEAKTGALLGCACAMGALYAGAGPEVAAAMDAFGREAGLAFQLIDDLIGIWGSLTTPGNRPGPISPPTRSHCRWWLPWARAPRRRRSSRSCTAVLWTRTASGGRPTRSTGPAGGTGRRRRPPTGWPGPSAISPGPSPTSRRLAVCSPSPST